MARKFFNTVYWAGLLAQIAIRMPHERQRQQQKVVVDRVTRQEHAIFGLLTLGGIVVPLLYMLTPVLKRANYPVSDKTKTRMGAVGMMVLACALWLFHRSHADLGKNWSPSLQVRQDHNLVTEGVYKRIRHPMYTSQLLWIISQALLLPNWVAGWASVIPFLSFYLLRIPHEEQMMEEQFGEEYRAYMQRTGRILPKIGA